jgi:flagellar export protein FliJ
MTAFRLATLERLRTTALEERGQELHTAALALAEGRAAHASIAEALRTGGAPVSAGPGAVERAAFYRERLRGDLELAAVEVARLEAGVAAARQAWLDARAELKAVTVLHERHREARRAELARREQAELDDLASLRAGGRSGSRGGTRGSRRHGGRG